jgi:electron transfer flavoprotein alpha subunit
LTASGAVATKSVLVVGELAGGVPSPLTRQLFKAARELTSGQPAAAFLGGDLARHAGPIASLPASRVYLLEHAALAGVGGAYEAPVDALAALCRAISPDIVLLPKTDFGANVGPRLASRLGSPFGQDCTAVFIGANGAVTVTRPVYGGNAVAEFVLSGGGPKIATFWPGANEADSASGHPDIVKFDVSAAVRPPKVKLIETAVEERAGVRLEDAVVVVSGGRGLGGPAPFKLLAEMADMLGGAVGASRAACDAGWIDHTHQVGLTGKNVSPRLYLAVGISGASQHMAGCSGAGTIVSINRDREANIFKEARFGVAGDWQKVLPAFISTVRDMGKL